MAEERYPLRVTEVGEFIHHKLCERRFKLEFNDRELAKQVPYSARLFNPIDPVLQAKARERENELSEELVAVGFSNIAQPRRDPNNHVTYPTWADFVQAAANLQPNQNAFGREVQVNGVIGRFNIEGRIDFLIILWRDGQPLLRIVEAKASRRDKTYHRIQVTMYRMLISQLIQSNPIIANGHQIAVDEIECSVVRIDEQRNEMQPIVATPPLDDLSQEEMDIVTLLCNEGPLVHTINTPLEELDYKLEGKCDECVFDIHCFPDSSLKRRLELLSIEPSDARVLRENGIRTIDDLAEIDLNSSQARNIMTNPSFTQNLRILKTKSRARRSTLPGGRTNPDEYQVEQIPYQGYGQLPEHSINGQPLIRIFLAVDHDYVEDRIVALSAHVTSSVNELETRTYRDDNDRIIRDPVIYEIDGSGNRLPLADEPVVHYISAEWSGEYTFDSGREGELIHAFFHELVEKIADVANGRIEAPIHFYVWSREEITHLIEACSRIDTRLLSHLNELFGCRQSLDQLIFSCLHDEISQRYALGWTGRSLSVATSLYWFGKKYHWTRLIHGQPVWLEPEFTQDIFDFKTLLKYRDNQTWETDPDSTDPDVRSHIFELRSRFYDGLTVPYWHALWRTLPDPTNQNLDPRSRGAITRYNHARNPGYIRAFMQARIHALRWLEERIRPKNPDITKPSIVIADLPSFTLNVTSTNQAAIDFLRLENHIKRTDWIAFHLIPPSSRISSGETIPVTRIRRNGPDSITVQINLAGYDIDINRLQVSSVFAEGSFVRLSPCDQDPNRGQRLFQLIDYGWTCVIRRLDWASGEIELSLIPSPNESRYVLPSRTFGDRVFDFGTIDSSVTDFVAKRVDEHLSNFQNSPTYVWFDPECPQIPVQTQLNDNHIMAYRRILTNFALSRNQHLDNNQIERILEGLNTRVQLLQGPPGTGKTVTTAIAILLRILARRRHGDIVLVSATTHTALDNLLNRIQDFLEQFERLCEEQQCHMPSITIAKVHSSDPEDTNVTVNRILNFDAASARSNVRSLTEGHVAIIGGTTSALLKMQRNLVGGRQFRDSFSACSLIIDEASMMVFPHFLALSTLLSSQGEIMLTGDHRQLAPIVSHDWENEDRPPIIVYQPFKSAYDAIRDIATRGFPQEAARVSALNFTFRLPPPLIELIRRLYRLDDIDLQGIPRPTETCNPPAPSNSWDSIWQGSYGLFLVLHSERQSQKYNELEAEVVRQIVEAGMRSATPPAHNSLAVVTPHRAQRSLLSTRLGTFYGGPVGIIDTVERLQGDQRPVVILSSTESDPSYISSNVGFILDLNRSNVAFSRSQDRLVVVCAETLINHVPADYEQYESTMLWKALRTVCSRLEANIDVRGTRVRVFTFEPPARRGSG